ncbi:DUF3304 domain-containing protein [Achromobacter aloeverae]|uniref:DUF3304 domain-containing protein n=1 Tax=Achromobacter aloeverae TaxID=1750518 RepID=A0A4Q1HGK2_9BURK|nr:DUF3304 domain-containing protein [Achromobacter aloeverae]RXN86220.1 hypothetical protein C7R54_21085 [Achromobacter aloeverae]
MRKLLMTVLMSLGLLAGCNGEPSYKGVSFIAYNYTQFDMDSVSVTDKAGESAATMQVSVGAGGGSVACCYTLKGTEFTAEWRAADPEVLGQHLDDGRMQEFFFTRKKKVTFAPAGIPSGDGPLVLELHIYPDEHVEMALSRKLVNGRLPIVDTTRWLWRTHKDALTGFSDVYEVLHTVARVTKTSWGKYRIEDAADMREYMKMYFTVASNFDQDPEVNAVLEKKDRQPGEFARAIEALTPERIAAMKKSGSAPGDKNG